MDIIIPIIAVGLAIFLAKLFIGKVSHIPPSRQPQPTEAERQRSKINSQKTQLVLSALFAIYIFYKPNKDIIDYFYIVLFFVGALIVLWRFRDKKQEANILPVTQGNKVQVYTTIWSTVLAVSWVFIAFLGIGGAPMIFVTFFIAAFVLVALGIASFFAVQYILNHSSDDSAYRHKLAMMLIISLGLLVIMLLHRSPYAFDFSGSYPI